MEEGKKLRVVQWATGNIGTRSLKALIEHPRLELVGLYVYSQDKAGRDAGALCGLGDVGIEATSDIADVIALKPDCVLYMPQYSNFDDLAALLEAGINVVTTRTEFLHPEQLDPELRRRIEAACQTGGASIHSTGSSPGFISEVLPLALTFIQRRLDSMLIEEFADMSMRNSPQMLFEVMGFGEEMAPFDERRLHHISESFGPALKLIAGEIGMPLDAIEAKGELAAAKNDIPIAAGTIRKGTVAAQRLSVIGMRGGRPFLTFRPTWFLTDDLDADWQLGDTGWKVSVDGDAPLEVALKFAIPLDRMAEFSPSFTANPAVNAVPYVCAAPPGIQSSVSLPRMIGRFS